MAKVEKCLYIYIYIYIYKHFSTFAIIIIFSIHLLKHLFPFVAVYWFFSTYWKCGKSQLFMRNFDWVIDMPFHTKQFYEISNIEFIIYYIKLKSFNFVANNTSPKTNVIYQLACPIGDGIFDSNNKILHCVHNCNPLWDELEHLPHQKLGIILYRNRSPTQTKIQCKTNF